MVVASTNEKVTTEVVEKVTEVFVREEAVFWYHRHQQLVEDVFGSLEFELNVFFAIVVDIELALLIHDNVDRWVFSSLRVELNTSVAPPTKALVVIEMSNFVLLHSKRCDAHPRVFRVV